MKRFLGKKNVRLFSFYVYVTRHGCYSETAVLHVGYSEARKPRTKGGWDNNYYPTWYSKSIPMEIVDKIHKEVHYMDGRETSNTSDVIKRIERYIEQYENK